MVQRSWAIRLEFRELAAGGGRDGILFMGRNVQGEGGTGWAGLFGTHLVVVVLLQGHAGCDKCGTAGGREADPLRGVEGAAR